MSHHRQSIRAVTSLFVLAILAAGCSKKDSGGPTGVSPPPPPPPPPPPTWTSLIGRSMTVAPNATQGFVCTQIRVPSDIYIKGFRTTASGVFRMLLTESSPSSPVDSSLLGDFPCSAGMHFDRIVYMSGLGTPDLSFPTGVGVHIKAGQFLMLTILEYNPTSAPENDSAQVSIEAGAAADVTHDADIMLAGARHFTIPVGTHQLVQGGCSEPLELQVFAMAPMMNLIGTGQVDLDAGIVSDTMLVDSTYSAEHQAYTTLQTPISIHHNDQIIINCYYDNTTGHVVAYGETTDAETCYDAMYRYPAPDSASSYSCLIN